MINAGKYGRVASSCSFPWALIRVIDASLRGESKIRRKYEANYGISTMLITNTGQSVPQIMNPFIWVFVTLLSIGAVQDMGGLAALFG